MALLFSGCRSFDKDLGDWDVRRVMNMQFMFFRCPNAAKYDYRRWNPSAVTVRYCFFELDDPVSDLMLPPGLLGWEADDFTYPDTI